MTTLSVSTRADRAEQLVERRTEWLPVQAHDGRTGVAMPSQRKAGLFHLTDGYTCSCPDYVYRRRVCKHLLATDRFLEVQA